MTIEKMYQMSPPDPGTLSFPGFTLVCGGHNDKHVTEKNHPSYHQNFGVSPVLPGNYPAKWASSTTMSYKSPV